MADSSKVKVYSERFLTTGSRISGICLGSFFQIPAFLQFTIDYEVNLAKAQNVTAPYGNSFEIEAAEADCLDGSQDIVLNAAFCYDKS